MLALATNSQPLTAVSAVPRQQCVSGGIAGIWLYLTGDCWQQVAGLLLTQFHTPLVEGVQTPDNALDEGDVLVQRNQRADCIRGELLEP